MAKRIVVLNELGFGNGVLALPFVRALQDRGSVWHVENPYFDAIGLDVGRVPGAWAYARVEDHEAMLAFGIDLLVSLRNEDYSLPFNAGYGVLRALLRERGVEVWDLYERPEETRHWYVAEQWRWLFARHGIAVAMGGRRRPPVLGEAIGVVVGASRADKRVALPILREVVDALVARGEDVRVISGRGEDEMAEAAALGRDFVAPPDVASLTAALRELRAVVCNDTFAMHLANALGVPAVALFSTTRRDVWGPPDSASFRGISSSACASCSWMPVQGYCFASPRCPSTPNEGFSAPQIVDAILTLSRRA